MSIYLTAGFSRFAVFRDEDDWEIFDNLQSLNDLAKKHNVVVERRGVNDGDWAIAVFDKAHQLDSIYQAFARKAPGFSPEMESAESVRIPVLT